MELTEAETQLIEQIRKLDWGRIETVVKDGKLVMISVKKDIKVDINLTKNSVSATITK